MKIINKLSNIPLTENGVLTIGTFDGLHLGHRKLIDLIIKKTAPKDTKSFVITFKNHPFDIIFPNSNTKSIVTLDFKINFFNKKGVDYLIFINFDKQFASITHDKFFSTLKERIKNMELVVGDFFKYGKDNSGNISYLKEKEQSYKESFVLSVVKHVYYEKEKVSSSRIRQLIKEGNINIANKLLAREYSIDGVCIKGERLGIQIGFPTINIVNNDMVIPKNGVYKTKLKFGDIIYSGMTFIGNKSIGNKQKSVIETHLLSFTLDMYNKNVCIFFQDKLRDEMEFCSIAGLKKQLLIDKQKALELDKLYSTKIKDKSLE